MLLPALLLLNTAWSQADAPPEPPAVEDEAPLLALPELLEFVEARYPAEAEAQGLQGSVLLLLEVDEEGQVRAAEVLREAGHGFDEAALEAAWQLVFTPAADATGPVPVALEFEYGFELASPPPEELPQELLPVNLEGTVVERGSRTPLEGVPLWIELDGERVIVRSDAQGAWSFRGVPLGEVTVTATWPGYEDEIKTVEILAGEVTTLPLWMTNRDYRENEVVGLYHREREPDVTRRTITISEVRRVPGTFGDPVRVIQSLPGAARPSFGSSQLILRGANPEDSNVYIDGVEVPIIYHLGGYRSVLNPSMISAVDYLPGGYGVRYGRSIGGVVDVRTTEDFPDRWKAVWHTDMLDSSLYTTGKAGKKRQAGLAGGVRRSYLDWLIKPFLPDDSPSIKPRWFDYQVKVHSLTSGPDEFSLLLFGFHDLMLIENPEGYAVGTDEEGEEGLSLSYQTHRLVGAWRREFSPQLDLVVRPLLGWDDTRFDMSTDMELLMRSLQLGLRSELRWRPGPAWQLTAGLDALTSQYDLSVSLGEITTSFTDPLQEADAYSSQDTGWSHSPDPYLDLQLRPLRERDALVLDLALRLETSLVPDMDPLLGLDPRFAMRWELVPDGILKLGTGLYQQHPELRTMAFGNPVELPLERAWSSEIGWLQRFGVVASADATFFYKDIDRLGVFNPDIEDFLEDELYVPDGRGLVYGMEILLRKERQGRLFGWVSYTLSRSLRHDGDGDGSTDGVSISFSPTADTAGGGGWYLYDYDQTHILTAIAGYSFTNNIDLSTRIQYVTGNPYTPYEDAVYHVDEGYYEPIEAAARNSARMDPYFSMDLRVSKLWAFKRWTLEGFVDLLNVLHGDNPEMIIYNYDYTESAYVQGLPFIPCFGLEAELLF